MKRFAEILLASACFFTFLQPLRAAGGLGGYPVVCPPGLTAYGNRCVRPRQVPIPTHRSPSRTQSRQITHARPLAIAPQARAIYPPQHRTQTDYQANPAHSEETCSRFNARFTPFYQSQTQHYESTCGRQADTEEQLRTLIADQKQLRDKLRRQSFGARHPTVRRTLMRQARAVDQDIRSKKALLRRLSRRNENKRSGLQTQFKARTQEALKQRPPGCRVEVLDGEQ